MERVCFLARVRPDRLDEYRERHKSVWLEMRDGLPDQSCLRIAEIFHLDLTAHHRRARPARGEFRARPSWRSPLTHRR